MSASLVEVYGPLYDPATHSWPVGVRPTGPVCRSCGGSGEKAYNPERDPQTGVWTATEVDCPACYGTGVRPPAGFGR